MKEIAFATCAKYPTLTEDDRLMTAELDSFGIRIRPLVWDAEDEHHQHPHTIIIRSCWDYHHQPERFLQWVSREEESGSLIWNPARVIEWNLNKTYLRDLRAQGVRVPDTIWLERNTEASLSDILAAGAWRRAVVKPLVSATAFRTWISSAEGAAAEQQAFEEVLAATGAMVQQFVPQVQTRGEWSLFFFGGRYSHAVLKRPKSGDFRVQEEYGGSSESAVPSAALLEQAARILELIEDELLFARIDGVEVDGELCLMELELIEPFLFLSHDPLAPPRFARAILERC